jgi:hypothetical protein
MAPSPQHSARKLSHSRLLLLALLCVAGTACGTTAQSNKVLFEDPRGTVSLQTISDQSIQANHPIDLKPALIARVLSGMQIQEYLQYYQQTMTGEAITPVFLPEEVQFLAPRIAKALTTAATGEAVAFLITSPRPGTGSLVYMETTAGSLYAYDQSLYVTLSQYRYDPMLTNMHYAAYRPRQLDPSGLRNRILLFTPSAALRSDNVHRPEGGAFTDRFLAIDYQLLQHASPAIATINAPDAPSRTTEALAQEVETLRKQLQSVQQQLDRQTTRQDSLKRETTPPSTPQETTP